MERHRDAWLNRARIQAGLAIASQRSLRHPHHSKLHSGAGAAIPFQPKDEAGKDKVCWPGWNSFRSRLPNSNMVDGESKRRGDVMAKLD